MQIQMNGISKTFDTLNVLSDFSISFSQEGIFCLFGASGCGKTTLLNILSGILTGDEGELCVFEEHSCFEKSFCFEKRNSFPSVSKKCLPKTRIHEKNFSQNEYNKLRKDWRISYIFQEERLLSWATVEENIAFVLKHLPKQEQARRVEQYLDLVELTAFRKKFPHELSGGMRQRTVIARAFAYEGDIFLMDEPFKGVHPELKQKLMDYILKYRQEKKGLFLFVTHNPEEVLYMADYVYMVEGPPLKIKRFFAIDVPKPERSTHTMKRYRHYLTTETKE